MVKIRLARGGSKKKPFYFLIAADIRSKRDGKFLEKLGNYNPFDKENKFNCDVERVQYWLSVGAQPTERVKKLMKSAGIEKA